MLMIALGAKTQAQSRRDIRRVPIPIKDWAACSLLVLRWPASRGVSTLRGLPRR